MSIFRKLFLALLIVAVAGGSLFFASSQGYLPFSLPMLSAPKLSALQIPPQFQGTIAQAGQSIQDHVGKGQIASISGAILGAKSDSDKTAAANVPLYQRAAEYARYTYCREVVKDYQSRYPE